MSKYANIFIVALFGLLAGCVSAPPVYYQRSPMIDTVKNSHYTTNSRREAEPVRYDPYTTLGSAVQQEGEVVINITFDYSPPQRSGQARTGNCLIHIKSSDSPLSDMKRCRVYPSGNTFMISFRTEKGEKSFDLHSLPGRYEGAWPVLYTNTYVTFRYSPGSKQNLRYVYVGKDPFGL